MKCLECGLRDYEHSTLSPAWVCFNCTARLPESTYEKIVAMQAVIAKLPVGYDDKPLIVGSDIYAESPETGELTRGKLVAISEGLLFDSYKGTCTIVWAEGNDGDVWECGNLECHAAREPTACTTAQPCGHCPRCKGSEAEDGEG